MDFHTLTRRELQAFCKKNKIPANMTNAAMADALKALEIVEGIEEFMQPSQSETAESSIESLEGSEVTSPYVPPTGGRSTCRRNVVKEELEAVTTMTRTRRTTRKTITKVPDESQVDTVETPALVAQTSRRKVQMASACRKMDSELKECVEEEKKDVSMTPDPLGATSRRRRVEEGTVQKVYSTRRSVRLAEKSVQMVNDVTSEGSELFKNDELLTKDSEQDQEVNQKEGLNDCTGVDAIAIVEENCKNEEKSEVVSAQKQDITIAVEVQPDMEICDNTEYGEGEETVMPVYVTDEVQQSEGSVDVCKSEIEVTVENSKEVNIEMDAGSQDEAGDFVEHVQVDEVSHDEGFCDEAEQEELHDDKDIISPEDVQDLSMTLVKLTELKLQQEDTQVVKMEGDVAEADSDFIDHLAIPEQLVKSEPDEMETLQLEESEKSADQELLADAQPSKQLSGVEDAPLNAASSIPSSAMKSMTAGFSDNKENNIISNGSKLVIMKEAIKPAKDNDEKLEEKSLRKLTKMFKEKLEISKKLSKHGNEATLPRPALQALP